MDNLSDIDAQIAELTRRKEAILQKQRDDEQIRKDTETQAYLKKVELDKYLREWDEAIKIDAERDLPLIVTVSKYTASQIYIKSNIFRVDYADKIKEKVPSLIKVDYNVNVINVKDYPRFLTAIEDIPGISIINKCEEHIEYYLNGPHAIVTFDIEKQVSKVKVHPDVSHYNIFKDMAGHVARLMNDGLYHVPKNELYRLLKLSHAYTAGKFTWDDLSLAIATKDLEDRQLLDEIALLEDAPDFDIDLNGNRLKPFQRVGVKFAVTTKQTIGKGFVRVLNADRPGLGKTWQAIATCQAVKSRKIACIVPASVKENWRREILRLTGEAAQTMKGTQPTETDILDLVDPKKRWFIFNYDMLSRPIEDKKEVKLENGQTMYETKDQYLWVEFLNSLGFDTLILDEAHKCKNVDSGRTKAILRTNISNVIELTGTPVINRPLELWPGLHLLDKDTFNNYQGFEYRYSAGKYGVRNVDELRNLLRPYMIRRKLQDVQKDMPPIVRETIQVEMTQIQKKVYDKLLNSVLADVDEWGSKEIKSDLSEINHILTKILRIKQFLSKIKAKEVAEHAIELYDSADTDEPHKKVIIFTQFVPNVHRLVRLLGNEARYIIGAEHSPLDRQLIVDDFQRNPRVQFLVATPQSTSEGLNITAAGHVIFCDYAWTPAMHEQGEGRAYGRIGDLHTIISHYFAVENSLDSWLRDIILQKLDTIEQVVEGVQSQRVNEGSIIKEMLRALKRGELR